MMANLRTGVARHAPAPSPRPSRCGPARRCRDPLHTTSATRYRVPGRCNTFPRKWLLPSSTRNTPSPAREPVATFARGLASDLLREAPAGDRERRVEARVGVPRPSCRRQDGVSSRRSPAATRTDRGMHPLPRPRSSSTMEHLGAEVAAPGARLAARLEPRRRRRRPAPATGSWTLLRQRYAELRKWRRALRRGRGRRAGASPTAGAGFVSAPQNDNGGGEEPNARRLGVAQGAPHRALPHRPGPRMRNALPRRLASPAKDREIGFVCSRPRHFAADRIQYPPSAQGSPATPLANPIQAHPGRRGDRSSARWRIPGPARSEDVARRRRPF